MTEASPPTNWGGIATAYIAGVVASVSLLKASPAALDLRAGFGLGLTQIAWISSIFTLTTVALGVFAGGWQQRVGARAFAAAGLSVIAFAGGASVLANSAGALLAGRLVEGVGFVLVVVAAPTLMVSLAGPDHRKLVLGIWSTWLPAGGVLIMLASPMLLASGGWRALWLSSSFASLLALVALKRLPPRTPIGDATPVDLAAVLTTSAPWFLAIGFAFFTVQLYAVLMFAPTYLVEELGFSLSQSTLITSIVLVMAVPGGLLSGVAMHRGVPPNALIAVCFALLSILVPCLVLFADSGLPGIGVLLVYGLCAGAVPGCIYAQAPSAARLPAATGIILGLVMAGNGLGILIGPPAVALVIEAAASWYAGLAVPVVACAGGIVCAWQLSRPRAPTPLLE